MEITPESPITRTAKVRVIKQAVPKSSSKIATAAVPKPKAAERKRKPLAVKSAAPIAMASASGQAAPSTELIAMTAYYLAEQRQFVPGHELDDWLMAEQQVLSSCSSKS
jgi:hypothetical protein